MNLVSHLNKDNNRTKFLSKIKKTYLLESNDHPKKDTFFHHCALYKYIWLCEDVHLQAFQTHTGCSMVDYSVVSAAVVTSHFTGHWRQAAAQFKDNMESFEWQLLCVAFLGLSKWWHQRLSMSSMVEGRWKFSVTLMLGEALVPRKIFFKLFFLCIPTGFKGPFNESMLTFWICEWEVLFAGCDTH